MKTATPATPATQAPGGLGLGTFLGVYTPTVLTILGVILYLRLGWVVGNAGVGGTLAIVLLANAITLITALSMSALSTNMRVGVGGAYFIISRSLGLELGGALGIPLYLSQALSVTLYAYGLAESVRIFWPGAPVQILAAFIVIGVVLVAARSTMIALKMQLPIMVLIGLSLASLAFGVIDQPQTVGWGGEWVDGDFWTVFAVFFPAVTGVLAGVGLSGDLRDPAKSIPVGVLTAVFTGFLVYMLVPLLLARAGDPAALRSDPLIWTSVAAVGVLVMPGLCGAILSSAIGSILGAPRTLQALAQDRLMPSVLGRIDEKTGEPMLALRISGGVALAAVALGDLNAVAEVVSMFFLTTYGMLNLAAGLEALVKDPSYRPRIRVPWWLSFVGAFGCFVAMFAINPLAFLAAVIIEVGIWWYLSRRSMEAAWGDLRSGLWMATARFSMLQLRESRVDPRNWRPNILVFTSDLERSVGNVAMASHFGQDRGIVTVCTLVVGQSLERAAREALLARNQALLTQHRLLAFNEVVLVSALDEGMRTVAQSNGFGGLASNMVMFGWPGESVPQLGRLIGETRGLAGIEKSTMIMRPVPGSRRSGDGRIVIWWKGKEHNGDLMLLMAHLLTLSADWRGTRISLRTIADTPEEAQRARVSLTDVTEAVRIHAEVEVIVRAEEQSVVELIREHSENAALIFLGLALVDESAQDVYAARLLDMLAGLPSAVLVRNAGPFRGRLV